MSTEPSERAREVVRQIYEAKSRYESGAASNMQPDEAERILTRYASAARLEEAEWWHAATNCTQSEAKEMNLRLLTLRAAQQKAPGEGT
jgi:putative SOS response-associated peptidase YedK